MIFMISNMIRAVWDSVSYWATFAIIQFIASSMGKDQRTVNLIFFTLIKSLVFWVSIANFSAFLQVAFMFDIG